MLFFDMSNMSFTTEMVLLYMCAREVVGNAVFLDVYLAIPEVLGSSLLGGHLFCCHFFCRHFLGCNLRCGLNLQFDGSPVVVSSGKSSSNSDKSRGELTEKYARRPLIVAWS